MSSHPYILLVIQQNNQQINEMKYKCSKKNKYDKSYDKKCWMNFVWKKERKKKNRVFLKTNDESKIETKSSTRIHCVWTVNAQNRHERPTDPIAMPFVRFLLIINQ